jgi:hypothetical protein
MKWKEVGENKVLNKTIGPKKDEVSRQFRIVHNTERHVM